MLSGRWDTLNIHDYSKAKNDIMKFAAYMFDNYTSDAILKKLTLFEQINQIDLHEQIIVQKNLENGKILRDKKGNEFDKTDKIMELKIRTKTFIVNEALKDNKLSYLKNNFEDILTVFHKDRLLAIAILREVKNKINSFEKKNPSKHKTLTTELRETLKELMKGQKTSKHPEIYNTIIDDLIKKQ